MGTFNNVKEIYVPRSDGWVFVYNAETFEKIDQIGIGSPSSCVINNNGNLFISTDQWTNYPLRVFSRTTKQQISKSGDYEDTRLRMIPGLLKPGSTKRWAILSKFTERKMYWYVSVKPQMM
jgi:hypothetical protein